MKTLRTLSVGAWALLLWSGSQAYGVHEWDGSRVVPFHRVPLTDSNGVRVIPTLPGTEPLSTSQTCGVCHPYEIIRHGLHFNALDDAPAGRRGEPWVWLDMPTGTQIPISYRDWPGTWRPAQLGLSHWDATLLWGRHMPGGSFGDPPDKLANPDSRWDLSGPLEVNCFACHNGSPRQDPTEWAKQIARQNLRWAATAASGLGEVGGMASRLHDSWLPADGASPDDRQYAVPPSVDYDPSWFDSKGWARLNIAQKPLDERCLSCHSVQPVGAERIHVDGDVHLSSGLHCADCHHNGLDHNIARGYEGEAEERGKPAVASVTCRGCHLGEAQGDGTTGLGGRFGAPRPAHKGLPPVHFEKLSCTACHSGVWSRGEPQQVRTSRANRLGIHGRARWDTPAPYICEPVFMKAADGKIAPHRMMWPAFWARLKGDALTPLKPETVAAAGKGILDAELEVGGVLASLTKDPDASGVPTLVYAGKVYHANVDGGVDVVGTAPAETAATWGRQAEDDSEIGPLVPEFEPVASEELDRDVAARIEATLKALESRGSAPGKAALVLGDRLYVLVDEFLEAKANPGAATADAVWGWLAEDMVRPLVSDLDLRSVSATVGRDETLTEEQVAATLAVLESNEKDDEVEYGYVAAGRLFRRGPDGSLAAGDHPAAKPYAWPIGHDVRPAAQSLGGRACTECHAADSPFFFSEVTAAGPLITSAAAVTPVNQWQQQLPQFHRIFGLTFRVRPLFKLMLLAMAAVTGALLLLLCLLGLYRITAGGCDQSTR